MVSQPCGPSGYFALLCFLYHERNEGRCTMIFAQPEGYWLFCHTFLLNHEGNEGRCNYDGLLSL
jgi:hypothetical protein